MMFWKKDFEDLKKRSSIVYVRDSIWDDDWTVNTFRPDKPKYEDTHYRFSHLQGLKADSDMSDISKEYSEV